MNSLRQSSSGLHIITISASREAEQDRTDQGFLTTHHLEGNKKCLVERRYENYIVENEVSGSYYTLLHTTNAVTSWEGIT